jgi:hypothetical protein
LCLHGSGFREVVFAYQLHGWRTITQHNSNMAPGSLLGLAVLAVLPQMHSFSGRNEDTDPITQIPVDFLMAAANRCAQLHRISAVTPCNSMQVLLVCGTRTDNQSRIK